jgi:hypothetical protein
MRDRHTLREIECSFAIEHAFKEGSSINCAVGEDIFAFALGAERANGSDQTGNSARADSQMRRRKRETN